MFEPVCNSCRRSYPPQSTEWRCTCGGRLSLTNEPVFSKEHIVSGEPSLWRYQHVLPVSEQFHLKLGEGWTPLVQREIGGHDVLLKLDHLFPSGSYKDRGAAVLMSKVKELGVERVVEDSSGNAGAAVAAYAAAAGVTADIYVPAKNSPEKLAQVRAYGARLVAVDGDRSATAAAAWEAAEHTYYASHVYNPYFIEGTKTFAFEVWEQLGFRAPDTVILPAGHGTLLLGSIKGFRELERAGLIEGVPRHIAVQSAACAPLAAAFAGFTGGSPSSSAGGPAGDVAGGPHAETDSRSEPSAPTKPGSTAAEGIAIAEPAMLSEMVEGVAATEGRVITVREADIARALREAVRTGLFIEPTAAAALAGVKTYLSSAPEEETVVSVVTGHGLKAAAKTAELAANS